MMCLLSLRGSRCEWAISLTVSLPFAKEIAGKGIMAGVSDHSSNGGAMFRRHSLRFDYVVVRIPAVPHLGPRREYYLPPIYRHGTLIRCCYMIGLFTFLCLHQLFFLTIWNLGWIGCRQIQCPVGKIEGRGREVCVIGVMRAC